MTPSATPTPIPAFAPVESPDSVLLFVLVLVLLLVAVGEASAALIVAKSRPAIVGNAALGLIGHREFDEVGQAGVGSVDGGLVFAVTDDHWLFKAS